MHISRQTRVAQVFRSVIDGDSNADDRDDDPLTLALMSGAYVTFFNPWVGGCSYNTQESKLLAYFHNGSSKTLVACVNYIFRLV